MAQTRIPLAQLDATLLSTASTVAIANGGTGRTTGTTAYALIATGTTATGVQQSLANGLTTQILVGGGAAALPVFTTATGTGAPVRTADPALTRPVITGITSGVAATAGILGQIVENTVLVGAAVTLTTTVSANITSISLTAGQWQVWASAFVADSSGNLTSVNTDITLTSATLNAAPNRGARGQWRGSVTGSANTVSTHGFTTLNLSATTTVYLAVTASFTGSGTAFGFIGAERTR